MIVAFIGMIHHRHGPEIHPPPHVVLDWDYIRSFAQAAEAGGIIWRAGRAWSGW